MRKALVLTHVPFEDPGSLSAALEMRGLSIETRDACVADLRELDALEPDLLIVLGGPIAVYEAGTYPFLAGEIQLLRQRLAAQRPTLGICLGAQLMAAALGAAVYPGTRGKEIGWAPLRAGDDVDRCPAIAELLAPDLHLLHWHGDSFDIPPGAAHLAATQRYPNQAWSLGRYALALQFHPEVQRVGLERWYVGHACELAGAGVDVSALRHDGERFAPVLEAVAMRFWERWLEFSLGS
ncbi:MAG TPA: glutamine amidotransferase [Steroidobacteraceae bacterium]